MDILQGLRDVGRLKNIAGVLFKHGLLSELEGLELKRYLSFSKRVQAPPKSNTPGSLPERIRLSFEELGGVFVKLEQLLRLRPDFLPQPYIEEFKKLQDHVPPFPYQHVKTIIEREFHDKLLNIFSSFEKTPIASASIGQVHQATLADGTSVAVKVQRPDIGQIFQEDIDLLYYLARLIDRKIPATRQYDLVRIVKEFERYTKKELNYMEEGRNIDRFLKLFANEKKIKIPKVYWNRTTSRVLTMEFIDGVKVGEVKEFSKFNTSPLSVAKIVTNSILHQIFVFGFFHADPHPGNVFVLPNGKVAFLDFGIVGSLDAAMQEKVELLLVGLIKPDRDLFIQSLIDVGIVPENTDVQKLRVDLKISLETYYNREVREINMQEFFNTIFHLSREYGMHFPVDFVLLVKSILTLEGLDRELYPKYNLVEACKPHIQEVMKNRLSARRIVRSWKENLFMFQQNLQHIPRDLRQALAVLKTGKLKVDIEDRDIQRFALEIDRSSNRIVFGLIIAALVVASALIMLAQLPPYFVGVPLIGVLFLAIAVFLSIVLIISIYREKGGVV